MQELKPTEIEEVNGGKNCMYEGKEYSPGSEKKMDGGSVKTCRDDGTWA